MQDGSAICDIGSVERETPSVTETLPIDPGDAPPVHCPAVGLTIDCSSGPGGTVTVTRHEGGYPSPPRLNQPLQRGLTRPDLADAGRLGRELAGARRLPLYLSSVSTRRQHKHTII